VVTSAKRLSESGFLGRAKGKPVKINLDLTMRVMAVKR
jgi:hypothetical protein